MFNSKDFSHLSNRQKSYFRIAAVVMAVILVLMAAALFMMLAGFAGYISITAWFMPMWAMVATLVIFAVYAFVQQWASLRDSLQQRDQSECKTTEGQGVAETIEKIYDNSLKGIVTHIYQHNQALLDGDEEKAGKAYAAIVTCCELVSWTHNINDENEVMADAFSLFWACVVDRGLDVHESLPRPELVSELLTPATEA